MLDVCCPIGGLCPRDCPRTQDGCYTIWGSDAEYLEALARNNTMED